MRRINLALFSLFALLALLLGAGAARADHPADVVLYNGKVFTVDSGRPWAQAVAIRGSRIIAVALRRCGPAGRHAVDRFGGRVVSGFTTSTHGASASAPDLPPTTPVRALSRRCAAQVAWRCVGGAREGSGRRRQSVIPLRRHPAMSLDPWRRTSSLRLASHSAVINTRAMAAAGISETEPDPFGGSYDRFPGTPVVNGVINEYALFRLVRAVRAGVPDAVLRAQFEALTAQVAQVGVTSVQEMTIGLTRARSERGSQAPPRGPDALDGRAARLNAPAGRNSPPRRLTSSGSIGLAGTPVDRSAALLSLRDFPGSGNFTSPGRLAQIGPEPLGTPLQRKISPILRRSGDGKLSRRPLGAPDFVGRLLRRGRARHMAHQADRPRRAPGFDRGAYPTPSHLELESSSARHSRVGQLSPCSEGASSSRSARHPAAPTLVDLSLPSSIRSIREALTMEQAVRPTHGRRADFQDWQKVSITRLSRRPGGVSVDICTIRRGVRVL